VSGHDPGEGGGGRMEDVEAHHRGRDPLNEAVVLFQYVVQVLDLPDLDGAAISGELEKRLHAVSRISETASP